jgi:hypothetical protein
LTFCWDQTNSHKGLIPSFFRSMERQFYLVDEFQEKIVVQLSLIPPHHNVRNRETISALSLRDGLSEKAILPLGNHVQIAIEKASSVLTAPNRGRASAMDDLLRYFLDQFPSNPDPRDISRVLIERVVEAESVRENVLPFMIMVELMSAHRLKIDLMLCPHWPIFAQKYGIAMMAA